MKKSLIAKVFVCEGLVAMGCFACASPEPTSSVADVSWVSDEKIYFLQEDPSGLKALWVETSGRRMKVSASSEVPDGCGPLDFIFKVRQDVLGVALECDGYEQLLAYSSGNFTALKRVPLAADVAILGSGSGYVGTGANGCWRIESFGQGAEVFSGETRENSCSVGSAKSPAVLVGGGMAYLRTERAAPETPVRTEERPWSVFLHQANSEPDVKVGPTFRGLPDLAASPAGPVAVVTMSTGDSGRVVRLDLATGATRGIYESKGFVASPSVSPNGRYVAFTDDGRLVKQEVPAG